MVAAARTWPLAAVVALLAASGAPEAPGGDVVVDLRVEGSEQTLFEAPVATDVHPVDGGDGTGPHPCSGGLGSTPGPTATGALDHGLAEAGVDWRGIWDPSFNDFFVDRIGPDGSSPPDGYWGVIVDGRSAGGGCTTKVGDGDEVLWAHGAAFRPHVLRLDGPGRAKVDVPFEVSVTAGDAPAAGATVGGATTGADGTATIVAEESGRLYLKAERDDAIRSNRLTICVAVADCVSDDGEPRSAITSVERGQRFARAAGPRILRGAHANAGRVRLAVRARGRTRGRCRAWSARRGRLVTRACGRRPLWFDAALEPGAQQGWRATIGNLPPGRYLLRSQARGPAGGEPRVDGRNRIDFRVLQRLAAPVRLRQRAIAYLRRAQAPPGGFGTGVGSRPAAAMTGWATLALAEHRARTRRAALALRRMVGPRASLADRVRTTAALAAVPRHESRRRLPRLRRGLIREARPDGSLDADANLTALAILALRDGNPRATGAADAAAEWLADQQRPDGGIGFQPGAQPDVDTTALAAWALATAELRPATVDSAIGFVRAAQALDGGFPALTGGSSNSQSTGLALAALRAAGVGPERAATEEGIDPRDYLTTIALRSGAIAYAAGRRQTPVWTTSQVLLGLP